MSIIKTGFEGRIQRGLVVGLLISFMALSQGLGAAERASGAKVSVITAQHRERITGELIGIREDAFVLGSERGEIRTIAVKDIVSLRVYRPSAVLPGILAGLLAGSGIGFAISAPKYKDEFLGCISIAIFTGSGAALGGLAGGLTAGHMSRDKIYDLTKMSAREVEKLLADLRKKARVPDYR